MHRSSLSEGMSAREMGPWSLLGHKRQDITTHYREAGIDDLIRSSDKALDARLGAPLRVITQRVRTKVP